MAQVLTQGISRLAKLQRLLAACLIGTVVLSGCSQPSTPQVTAPLVIDIEELCTQCVEVLRCDGDEINTTIYVLHKKSFWAQIATIWDYLIQAVSTKTEDFRDVTKYVYATDSTSIASSSQGRARLDVWLRRIELPDSVVDETNASWTDATGKTLGACVHLPRVEGITFARTLSLSNRTDGS